MEYPTGSVRTWFEILIAPDIYTPRYFLRELISFLKVRILLRTVYFINHCPEWCSRSVGWDLFSDVIYCQ